jgi:hypothetical protein
MTQAEFNTLWSAISNGSGAEVEATLRTALQRTPQLAKMKAVHEGGHGLTLLHHVADVQGGASGARLVQLLHQANPQAALTPETRVGALPLHIAARWQGGARGAEVVEALLQAEPRAAAVAGIIGNLPLHVAAYNQGSGTMVTLHTPQTDPQCKVATRALRWWSCCCRSIPRLSASGASTAGRHWTMRSSAWRNSWTAQRSYLPPTR